MVFSSNHKKRMEQYVPCSGRFPSLLGKAARLGHANKRALTTSRGGLPKATQCRAVSPEASRASASWGCDWHRNSIAGQAHLRHRLKSSGIEWCVSNVFSGLIDALPVCVAAITWIDGSLKWLSSSSVRRSRRNRLCAIDTSLAAHMVTLLSFGSKSK